MTFVEQFRSQDEKNNWTSSCTLLTFPNNTMSLLIAGQPEDYLQSNRTYYFHHETNTWTNGPHLTTARKLHAAGVIKDRGTLTEHVVVTGGAHYGDLGDETVDSVEIMFSNENKWTSGTSCLRIGKSLN